MSAPNDWDDWDDQDGTSPDSPTAAGPAMPRPQYPDVAAWVTAWLAPTVRRHVNDKRGGEILAWCPCWHAHPEAVDRLTGMWRAWEASRVDTAPSAVADWWLSVADPMLTILMDPYRGPFADCHRSGHADTLPRLPLDPQPAAATSEPPRSNLNGGQEDSTSLGSSGSASRTGS